MTEKEQIHQLMDDIQAQVARLQQMVSEYVGTPDDAKVAREKASSVGSTGEDEYGKVIEGVFDGQNMIGPDGKVYTVPANYASKSKLVEGDIMKLTITDDGSFIYKQIGPVDRKRVVGALVADDTHQFRAVTEEGRSFRLLTASVTYYRGTPGDSVIMLVPQEMDSKWAAVENIVPADEEVILDDEIETEAQLDLGDELSFSEEGESEDDSTEDTHVVAEEAVQEVLLTDGSDGLLEGGDDEEELMPPLQHPNTKPIPKIHT